MGDIVHVKSLGMDKGKLSLTMKGVEGNPEPDPNAPKDRPQTSFPPRRDDRGGGDRGRRDNGRNDRFRR